ncbi:MAG: c-type cytochrome domain-containing protein [Bacteroidia bacterium]
MRLHYFLSGLIIFLLATGITDCTKDKGQLPPPVCNTPAVVSFSADVNPLFQTYCSTSGCHTGGSPAGNLNLDAASSYTALMKPGSGYIDTVNANFSLLYSQMISASSPMPPTGKLDDCKTGLILKWIQQKAKHN